MLVRLSLNNQDVTIGGMDVHDIRLVIIFLTRKHSIVLSHVAVAHGPPVFKTVSMGKGMRRLSWLLFLGTTVQVRTQVKRYKQRLDGDLLHKKRGLHVVKRCGCKGFPGQKLSVVGNDHGLWEATVNTAFDRLLVDTNRFRPLSQHAAGTNSSQLLQHSQMSLPSCEIHFGAISFSFFLFSLVSLGFLVVDTKRRQQGSES
mmetsp:Transcript_39722/g.102301  ORF Transcript_39722/g.102301 Transcript_39722/m.102301 type:complete len:201 (+) Transcript_39722:2216-2818(+)